MYVILVIIMGLLAAIPPLMCKEVIFGYENEKDNKVKNWDFEQEISPDDWFVRNGRSVTTRVTGDCHTGQYCLKVENRSVETSSYQLKHIYWIGYEIL